MTRIAIVDKEKCKPDKCSKECMKYCPPQRSGKHVIDIEDIGKSVSDTDKIKLLQINNSKTKKIAKISENLCIGCNQCVRVCPFNAIKIVNLPEEDSSDIVHRYSFNGFRLYKMPIMKTNTIIGIIGENGVGKTTIIDILSNKIRPNFEKFNKIQTDKEIITHFRGTVLQDYLKNLYNDKLTFSIKEQKINQYVSNLNLTVKEFLYKKSINIDLINLPESYYYLEINKIINSNINTLSGGELQRLLCWITAVTPSNVYIFDEPSNYLDIKQRLEISRLIRSVNGQGKYVIVIEHDLSLLDYISDEIYIVYGKPSAYGIVSKPLSTLEGINMYLNGYITTQNIRFREEEYNLKPTSDSNQITTENNINNETFFKYSDSVINFNNYKLTIPEGKIQLNNNIIVILGENGTGKTTFIKWLAKSLGLSVSFKEQSTDISKYKKDSGYPTVIELVHQQIRTIYYDPVFQTDIVKKLDIENIESRYINELSGGELQRLLIVLCLGKSSDLYLFDEPSANLDIEYRLIITKIIKRYIINNKKTAFIIEHDIMMSVAFAQELGSKILIVKQDKYENNIKYCSVSQYYNFYNGINNLLKLMNITMRISNHNRPRINKYNSQLDQEQKKQENYYGI